MYLPALIIKRMMACPINDKKYLAKSHICTQSPTFAKKNLANSDFIRSIPSLRLYIAFWDGKRVIYGSGVTTGF